MSISLPISFPGFLQDGISEEAIKKLPHPVTYKLVPVTQLFNEGYTEDDIRDIEDRIAEDEAFRFKFGKVAVNDVVNNIVLS